MKTRNSLLTAMSTKDTTTTNGALSNSTSGSALLDFFGKAGALRAASEGDVLNYFTSAYAEDKTLALRILFYSGDVRGGQGERRLFRTCYRWLAQNDEKVAKKLLKLVPEYRRWDDVTETLEETPLEQDGLKLLAAQLKKDVKAEAPSLAGKWAPSAQASSDTTRRLAAKLRKEMRLSPRNYRKLLSGLRERINVVERLMCDDKWGKIDFSTVPSRAALLYKSAFNKHEPKRYASFLTKVEKGEVKINAGTLYPYDIVRDLWSKGGNDARTLEAQWKALPDYLADNPHNGLVVADVSGSMSGQPMDVCLSLAIYFAERNVGAFNGYFMTFSGTSKLEKLKGNTLKEKIGNLQTAHWEMNTNLQSAFDSILGAAVRDSVPAKDMPKAIYIISDMQFDACVSDGQTNLDAIRAKYKAAGYKLPSIVFWCVNAHSDSPVTVNDKGVCLVSGCSPSILKTVLSGKVVTPMDVLKNTVNVERYEPISA
jgi:hypothetical protein